MQNEIMTKKSIERATADVGFMMTAYNLKQIINTIGKKAAERVAMQTFFCY